MAREERYRRRREMKIAVSSNGTEKNSGTNPRFGRARFFLIYDTESGAYRSVDNHINVEAAQGAGIQAAARLSDEEVDVLITGHCGPNAFHVLNAAGIKVVTGADRTVMEDVERYLSGELKETDGPDVERHWSES
jgi:predicted Fe-Mo cluster-binding NifX family protein